MTLENIERRLQVLEDVEAIKKLKARYLYYNDDSYNADGIASLFVEDGVRDHGPIGRLEGREAIRAYFAEVSKAVPMSLHFAFNPIITVNGDKAHGSWYSFLAATLRDENGDRAMWRAGRYEDDCVRVNGEWKFKEMRLLENFYTPFDQG